MKKVVILVGPSAVGKTTVAHAMLDMDGRYEFVRSVTTRAMRGDSFDNEYIYISREEFLHQIENGGVLEYTEYAGQFYGTPRSEIDRITAAGRVPLLILDLNGANSLYNAEGISPCTVYLYDDIEVIEERLYSRYITDNTDEADQRRYDSRIKQNRLDYSKMSEYEPFIYSFVKNCASVADCANRVNAVYDEFVKNAPKDADATRSLALGLSESITAKM